MGISGNDKKQLIKIQARIYKFKNRKKHWQESPQGERYLKRTLSMCLGISASIVGDLRTGIDKLVKENN